MDSRPDKAIAEVDINKLIEIVRSTDEKVLKIYNKEDLGIEYKEDNSPLTLADKVSQESISSNLKSLYPQIPILSEETERANYKTRKEWEYFWLVDPLDGTKEFIKRNGEFTVNLALIYKGEPVLGIVSIPAKGVLYFAQSGKGAFKWEKDKRAPYPIKAREEYAGKIVVAKSRSHSSSKDNKIISCLENTETITAGSSLKFCYVAEGKADIYLRGGRTMEWDTAAGQCIAESAGAKVFSLSGSPLKYNKKSLLNDKFICACPCEEVLRKVKQCLSSLD